MKGLPYTPTCEDQQGCNGKEYGMEHRKGEIGNSHPKALHRKQEQRPSEQSVRQRMNHRSRPETIACAWVNHIDSLCKMEVSFKFQV